MQPTAKQIKLYYAVFLLTFLGLLVFWASESVSDGDIIFTRFAFVTVGLSAFASAYGLMRRSRWLTLAISALFATQPFVSL